jgi:membrane protein implicated in regulation of membrane protease activity
MYLVAIAWLYIAVMMAAAEATHPTGSVLGALFTFLLYGVLPVAIVVYIMGAPKRRKVIKARETAEQEAFATQNSVGQPVLNNVEEGTSKVPHQGEPGDSA